MEIVKLLERKAVIRFFGIALLLSPFFNTFLTILTFPPNQARWTWKVFWYVTSHRSAVDQLLYISTFIIGILMLRGAPWAWKCLLVLLGAYITNQTFHFGPATTAMPAAADCPLDAAPDPARDTRIRAALATVPEGRALIDGSLARVRAVCFGHGPLSVVTHEHIVVLDEHLGDAEAAARLGHLLVHERDGHPMDAAVTAERDCAALVHEALVRESRAYATESRLRRALEVSHPVMPFEIEADTAPLAPADADLRWLAYLEAHPDGAPGIDALGAGYLAQCERERSGAVAAPTTE